MATQSPIEQEGSYPVSEAQMARFLMHVYIDYPGNKREKEVIRLVRNETKDSQSKEESPISTDAGFHALKARFSRR